MSTLYTSWDTIAVLAVLVCAADPGAGVLAAARHVTLAELLPFVRSFVRLVRFVLLFPVAVPARCVAGVCSLGLAPEGLPFC